MLLRKKRLQSQLKIVSAIALVCIGVLAFAANAYASNVPSAGLHQSSQNQSFSLSQKPATWITQPGDLSGKTVHFAQINSTYTKGGQGLGDGRKVQGDIWESIGPNGQVTAFHGVYTSLDGKTFYQEIFENTATHIVIHSHSVYYAKPRNHC